MSEIAWSLTPETWTAIAGVCAIVNVACTAFIARAAVVGFRTLEVTRESLALSKQSLADEKHLRRKVTAIEQNERFHRELVPAFHDIETRHLREMESWASSSADASFGVSDQIVEYACILGDSIEAWSLFVINDVADDDLLFRVAGREFCRQVEALARYARLTTPNAIVRWRAAYELRDRWAPKIGSYLAEVGAESKRLREATGAPNDLFLRTGA